MGVQKSFTRTDPSFCRTDLDLTIRGRAPRRDYTQPLRIKNDHIRIKMVRFEKYFLILIEKSNNSFPKMLKKITLFQTIFSEIVQKLVYVCDKSVLKSVIRCTQ